MSRITATAFLPYVPFSRNDLFVSVERETRGEGAVGDTFRLAEFVNSISMCDRNVFTAIAFYFGPFSVCHVPRIYGSLFIYPDSTAHEASSYRCYPSLLCYWTKSPYITITHAEVFRKSLFLHTHLFSTTLSEAVRLTTWHQRLYCPRWYPDAYIETYSICSRK